MFDFNIDTFVQLKGCVEVKKNITSLLTMQCKPLNGAAKMMCALRSQIPNLQLSLPCPTVSPALGTHPLCLSASCFPKFPLFLLSFAPPLSFLFLLLYFTALSALRRIAWIGFTSLVTGRWDWCVSFSLFVCVCKCEV